MYSHKSELDIASIIEAMSRFTDADGNVEPRVKRITRNMLTEYNQLIAKLVAEQENNNGSTN